ncbi:type 1 glutamine amidotransferase-like domain-containing protein [Clostridium sp. P21]|uniref:Type 1 glutamine amidotransferase-like domain-containing protein n=1 Tax=Clostridium muellerianum TaxID=2716538 RepID=A0A7Y0EF17_9CLOT|nr:Type 1 glutamine amidotransferase-like domain-containing protein [Clostridium muellerianum]NMM62242.1 type 1 glutamine amidotransferase-like domain-containing protein [Clostridium muellerianum]
MKRLLLTAYGLCTEKIKEAFYELLPENIDFSTFKVVIVTTSQPELKEKHHQMISVKNTFHEMGFKNVNFIDIEFEDPHKLQDYDIIFLNGGYPFYILHHLKRTGGDIILKRLIDDGKIMVGLSCGSYILGKDNLLLNYLYPEDNIFHTTDMSTLNAVDVRIWPHFKEHCGIHPELAERILEFEAKYNYEVTRLNNDQALLVLDDKIERIG